MQDYHQKQRKKQKQHMQEEENFKKKKRMIINIICIPGWEALNTITQQPPEGNEELLKSKNMAEMKEFNRNTGKNVEEDFQKLGQNNK